ncbi:Senescence regulator [Heracleum sosnowskyi]|uniref:Senescence regulator n=1 Tax=Heracleum sosnowskyi TaxID=360622 RepID=A0AAD8MJ09_9APIA|nr:Senescence regulator [Heracleum sosnowskyi]
MAKGRKLTISRSERLLGSYNHGQTHATANADPDFLEDDVWSAVDGDDRFSNNSYEGWTARAYPEINRRVSIRSHMHGGNEDGHVGGLSYAFDDPGRTASPRILHQIRGQEIVGSPRGRQFATSAPVNVPDWTKMWKPVESMDDSDECDDVEFDKVPPHEYLARSRNSAAHSVFEGVGRTLKGRDMSRVRDAVWSQTGFDG